MVAYIYTNNWSHYIYATHWVHKLHQLGDCSTTSSHAPKQFRSADRILVLPVRGPVQCPLPAGAGAVAAARPRKPLTLMYLLHLTSKTKNNGEIHSRKHVAAGRSPPTLPEVQWTSGNGLPEELADCGRGLYLAEASTRADARVCQFIYGPFRPYQSRWAAAPFIQYSDEQNRLTAEAKATGKTSVKIEIQPRFQTHSPDGQREQFVVYVSGLVRTHGRR